MRLNPADDDFIQSLCLNLPSDLFSRAGPAYLEEPRGRWTGADAWLARPRSTDQVSQIVAACAAMRVGLMPYGGGTGLVGGQIAPAPARPLILSLERMDKIRAVHRRENIAIVEAGAILANVQQAARAEGRLFPLSLASEGSARIGGLLACNAGGVNVLRYGNARDLCLGLEAVLPDGQVWHGLKRLRKDNTGYDLRNLLIGSEGSLGVITAASLRLFAQPAGIGTALLVVPSPAAAVDLLALAQGDLGESISAFELISGVGLDFLRDTLPDVRRPFDPHPPWMVLMEIGLPQRQDPSAALEALFAKAAENDLVSDGLVAQNQTQRQEFWTLREHIPLANRAIGAVSSHDISVPVSAIPEFIEKGHQRIAAIGPLRINCFGHVGDGNLHFNVFPPPGVDKSAHHNQRAEIKRSLHDLVHELDGSVSAEHGIGRLKTDDLDRYGDPAKLWAMRAIKTALDPHGIMNPGAVLPTQ